MTSQRLTIVHVLTRLLRAGSEENTLFSCRFQAAAGHRVILVHGRDFDPGVAERARRICEVVCVASLVHPLSPIFDTRAVRDLARLFKREGADIVHTHQSKAGVLGRLAARLARTPTIIHGVHILPFVSVGRLQAAIYVVAERFCARFTHAFISVSPSVRDACLQRRIGRPQAHFVAFSAMDVDRFKTASPPDDWRSLLDVAEGAPKPPTALMLAAFEPRKRHEALVRALPAAFQGVADWRLVFAGEGAEEAAVRALVQALGLERNVRFAGYRTDPERLIALADVGLLTSEREGLPRVIVQYAAGGKAIVVSDLPGLGDVVADGASAIVTPGDDVAAAAAEVAALLADPAKRERYALAAQGVEVDRWSPASMDGAIKAAYSWARRALAEPAADPGRPARVEA